MRQEAEFFGEAELDLIYMARRLRDALKLEGFLNEAGVDYLVETGMYSGGFLFKRDLTGAFFYVAPGEKERAVEVLIRNGMKAYSGE
jgi:hypothetical protein